MVCRAFFPDLDNVQYNEYSSNKQLKDILQTLDDMKLTWKGNVNGNEPFAIVLSGFLLNERISSSTKF